ncbi:MAG: pentapeptide repeat-containing protein [Symploca sp. SIO1A3]|nr:pentapeptide repeat-containing protein [Symploca sp. SIO2C1]NER52241.1 pentapeptide repeat-containing protein [Symploca sp. SIO1A3]
MENCNFKDSDIRGVNFTNANLKGANFHGAKAGLGPYWATGLVIISCIVAALLVSVLECLVHRTVNTIISTITNLPNRNPLPKRDSCRRSD